MSVSRLSQQYFSPIVAVSFIGRGSRSIEGKTMALSKINQINLCDDVVVFGSPV
jgi:hypothetical protein